MSRKRCEFEHRTSVFEGAYRAWSHLSRLDPEDLKSKTAAELDPVHQRTASGFVTNTKRSREHIGNDESASNNANDRNSTDVGRSYAHQKLPVNGLGHPYVQAILAGWLPSNPDKEGSLSILRTWWNHRRKGQSKSALQLLGTDEMIKLVDKYTSYFFALAHRIEVHNNSHINSNEPQTPPPFRSPQQQQAKTATELDLHGNSDGHDSDSSGCLDDEEEEEEEILERPTKKRKNSSSFDTLQQESQEMEQEQYQQGGSDIFAPSDDLGDVIVVTTTDDHTNNNIHQIAFTVDGITCVHCITVIETILNGCEGNDPPIRGILGAVADIASSMVLVKIRDYRSVQRIATMVIRNLAIMGYNAKAKCRTDDKKMSENSNMHYEVVSRESIFDWYVPCSCSNPLTCESMLKCERHAQINKLTFGAFSLSEIGQ